MKIEDMRQHDRDKTCHLRPGDCVFLYNNKGEQIPGLFIVCSAGKIGKELGSSGLYSADVPVFLVNLETGEACSLPHLSSRLTERVKAVTTIH